MAVKSKPFYWLECDDPGCESEYPGDGGEYTAYSGIDSLDYATDSDWLLINGKHFCEEHAGWHCRECGVALSEAEQDAGEYECFACVPELVKTT